MKKIFACIFGILTGFGLLGCASHDHIINGRQPASYIPAGFRVAIGSKEVNIGDTVNVFKSVCRTGTSVRAGTVERCLDEKVGEAVVLSVIDHDTAIVESKNGLVMDQSMKVEKK